MATSFIASATWSQSSDGKTLTLRDNSNWVDNTDGYQIGNYSRSFVLKNSSGNTITTLPLSGVNLSVDYGIIKDQYFSATLNIIGTPNFSTTINFGASRFTRNARDKILLNSCGCGCGCSNDDSFCAAIAFLNSADDAVLFGNGVKFDKDISRAFTLLN